MPAEIEKQRQYVARVWNVERPRPYCKLCADRVSDVIDMLAMSVSVDVVLALGKNHPASRLAIAL